MWRVWRAWRAWRAWLWIRRLLLAAAVLAMILAGVLLARTCFLARPPPPLPTPLPAMQIVVPAGAAQRLQAALRIPTVSYDIDHQETDSILRLHSLLEESFPLVHSADFVSREKVNKLSLLYTVHGSSDAGRLPYLLAAHLDVVPASAPAFQPVNRNNTIFARGAIDDKAALMAILEALELLLGSQQRPTRTFFIAFGHDEEISGRRGAQEIAKLLASRGVDRLDFVLDEGFPLTRGLMPGTSDKLVAVIGLGEKGSANVELKVKTEPRHSSLPLRQSAIGILAAAIAKLEAHPQPSLFAQGPEKDTFTHLVPYVSFGFQVVFSNMWLFAGFLASRLETHPIGNSLVRTTTAVTIFHAGIKENVVGGEARAVINHRVHPASTVAAALAHDMRVIGDPRVSLRLLTWREASPIAPCASLAFRLLERAVLLSFPSALVVPGTFPAATDTRWYLPLCVNTFRFLPLVLRASDIDSYHGDNESISLENFHRAVRFFHTLILEADLHGGSGSSFPHQDTLHEL